jgi:diguanylate cyclase (GGDEF)-like protein
MVKLRGGKKARARGAQEVDSAATDEDSTARAGVDNAAERAAEAERAAAAEREAAVAERADAAERAQIAEMMYNAARARAAALEAREKAVSERDTIANMRDRTAVERDSIANARDRAAGERETIVTARIRAGREDAAETPDDEALERARLEAELQRAHLDSLTGAFRREVGRLALRNEIERARRADGKFIIAFVDVDGLKGVNDRDGHAAGDRVLRTLAATMRANLRSYDPIVRFGGDEFICGISSIGTDEVQHRIGVIDQSLRHATGVGITAGLASLNSNETLDELTERADAALLEAKRSRAD